MFLSRMTRQLLVDFRNPACYTECRSFVNEYRKEVYYETDIGKLSGISEKDQAV